MLKKAIFPGSFDPITIGHYDIINRASELFDEVYVALGTNTTKPRYFTVDKCIKMIEDVFKNNNNIKVIQYDFLTVDLCKKLNVKHIVRGIRNVSDFEFERSLATMNNMLNPKIHTIFFDSKPEYLSISSTIIRELLRNNGDVSNFVPKAILKYIK
ncbi:MAG: pantetheine-phosphate adenylyltransferase [Bacteroidota bacterium]|nr:pantetheine-phosphate adenylyltransferase [Bacteroidota bacterium]